MNILRARISRGALLIVGLLCIVAMYGVVWVNRESIGDWARLNAYKPSDEIAALADATSMTPKARSLFYVNNPQLEDRSDFNKHCTKQSEHSIVLGCFLGNRKGIHIFKVSDPALNGVEEVTAAHEMLHQAYERLDGNERKKIDAMLIDFANNSLKDEEIKSQVALYKENEPNEFANELHSLLGTQVAELPVELEAYYKQYFKDRSVVTGLYAQYRTAFTKLQQQVHTYDEQLATLKKSIESLENKLDTDKGRITALNGEMNGLRNSDIPAFNRLVPVYNNLVDTYNTNLSELQSEIAQYNQVVEDRNAIAVEERQLQQELSSRQLPDVPEE